MMLPSSIALVTESQTESRLVEADAVDELWYSQLMLVDISGGRCAPDPVAPEDTERLFPWAAPVLISSGSAVTLDIEDCSSLEGYNVGGSKSSHAVLRSPRCGDSGGGELSSPDTAVLHADATFCRLLDLHDT